MWLIALRDNIERAGHARAGDVCPVCEFSAELAFALFDDIGLSHRIGIRHRGLAADAPDGPDDVKILVHKSKLFATLTPYLGDGLFCENGHTVYPGASTTAIAEWRYSGDPHDWEGLLKQLFDASLALAREKWAVGRSPTREEIVHAIFALKNAPQPTYLTTPELKALFRRELRKKAMRRF